VIKQRQLYLAKYKSYKKNYTQKNNLHLNHQVETEPSSAGEQLVRDMLDERQKCQINGLSNIVH
jgi:hypothetical protein